MSTATISTPRRIDVFDGLRGIAIILVVLSHGWTIWPSDYVLHHRPLSTLFASGNFAVSIFFVVGMFLATQAMLRRAESPAGIHPAVEAVRRYFRLTIPLAVLLVTLVVVKVFDDTEPYPDTETGTSIVRILTYSWNFYVRANPMTARPDLGHLWYLSVDMQAFLLVAALVWLLHRRRVWLAVTLTALLVGSELWTQHVYPVEGYYQALLRTSVRIDAPLAGALAAVLYPWIRPRLRRPGPMFAAALVALVPLAYLCTPNKGYFTWPGLALDVALMTFVLSGAALPSVAGLRWTLASPPLVALGRRSLSLYAWHYPTFYFMSRHFYDWDWWWRAALAISLTVLAVLLVERFVEARVQRALQSPSWRELDFGFPAFSARRWKAWRARRSAAAEDEAARQHTSA